MTNDNTPPPAEADKPERAKPRTFEYRPEDNAAIAAIRARYRLSSDIAAIRFALRELAERINKE